jgi:cellulose synthase/poly-beta-1,6-N-acetylglucosamine synthase-like glycosyltransferase
MPSVQGLKAHTTASGPLAPHMRDQVSHYAQWLIDDIERNTSQQQQEDTNAYIQEALTTVTVKGRDVTLFAPFRYEFSALRVITPVQIVVLGLLLLACILGFFFFHIAMIVGIIALITVIYLSDLILSFILSARTLNLPAEEHIDETIVHALADAEWPRYTILCPLYREVEVVPQFVQAMQALDYPEDKLQILFLTEEDDASTRLAIQAMHLPAHFSIITVPDGKPRTKPRACNYGLIQATGDYIVIYDAEDIPDPLQLKKAVLAFAHQNEKTACVQAKLNFYNAKQNLLTRWFTAEYSLWFDLTLPGLQKLGVPLPLGGTSNHFRTSLLRSLGAWDAFNVTEDCDLGLRMAYHGFKTVVLDSTTYEEANSQVKNWIRQRSRWIKGYMQTYLVYMRHPETYLTRGRLAEFFSLQVFVGAKTGVLLVNPFMWALLLLYILFHPVALFHTLFPGPVLYMAVTCLIFGNFFYTYSHFIGCMKRGQYDLVKWTLLIFIYWGLASVAAFMALQQLIFKPHYWEKTKHGLHLQKSNASPNVTLVTEESAHVYVTENMETSLTSVYDDFELLTTHVSSSLSITKDSIEIEMTEKTMHLKVHTQPTLTAIHSVSASATTHVPDNTYNEDDETTIVLPRKPQPKTIDAPPTPENSLQAPPPVESNVDEE